ncbi:MAG TPA: CBS domain-containing protein [Puia sp.]|nr:CBS domain-containing protein [Puia sp.]
MLNKEIISASIPSLSPNDPVYQALDLMSDFHVSNLAVVAEDKLLGIISENDLLNVVDEATTISQLENITSKIAVHANAHFIEAVQRANEFNLTVIPVIDKEDEYLGSISSNDLLQQLGKLTGVSEPGGVIVLEMEQVNFSFSELSKLVETNDAQITQLNSYTDPQSKIFYVTIKLNKFEIADIIATFQRYDYHVKYSFGEELYENDLRSNYDHLMNYLNI